MPDLIKLYIRQCLIGFGLAAAFVALLLAFNVQNLWSLISGSDVGLLAAFMLWFFNGIVFAGVQFGVYVTLNASDDTLDGRGHQPVIIPRQVGHSLETAGNENTIFHPGRTELGPRWRLIIACKKHEAENYKNHPGQRKLNQRSFSPILGGLGLFLQPQPCGISQKGKQKQNEMRKNNSEHYPYTVSNRERRMPAVTPQIYRLP